MENCKERLNNLAQSCLHFGDYHFMLSKIMNNEVTEEPKFFGRIIMSKTDRPEYLDLIIDGVFGTYSSPENIYEQWFAIESNIGLMIFNDEIKEYYWITRN
jgi:hypothetical protein